MGLKEAEELLDEAYRFKLRAEDLLKKGYGHYSGSVQNAQSCIELSVKSLFKLVDLPYPHLHDPTGTKGKKPSEEDKVKGIKKVLDKLEFPEGSHYKQDIARSIWISKMSEEFHTSTIYGYLDVGASKIFEKKDAQILSDYASEVMRICGRVVNAVRTGQIKII